MAGLWAPDMSQHLHNNSTCRRVCFTLKLSSFTSCPHPRPPSSWGCPGCATITHKSLGEMVRSHAGVKHVISNVSHLSPLSVRAIQAAEPPPVTNLPAEYKDLAVAFSKVRASQLPPHQPYDCAIDLIPGSMPPKGHIFPLSQPEFEAMKSYIEEELAKGFIRPSTSPASAGFFFVHKKDGGLRPCIDLSRFERHHYQV